ncbi:hypothetical protein [Pedobacter sandarakinus]|uniref:hypothetical protein n=1 Tax=Pedobacter sandarakinus TaxID=353156 RepID=UPI002245FE38|nr:hypothetical protein [Pedobacter sandarakinus]MCX2575077.1 hypothetical protein [Pedobacter sandarakinus]
MTRSLRKTKIFQITTAASEKLDKRRWNKTFRKVSKSLLGEGKEAPYKIQGVSGVWDGAKDGKRYRKNTTMRDMRK